MGAVYECVHLTTRKRRALKVMLPQILAAPGMRERFDLEARVTARIESEHIVETFDAGIDEATGAPFLVDPGAAARRGGSARVLPQERSFDRRPGAAPPLAGRAGAGEDTHAAGIVHRDLKPRNLFVVTRDDGSPRLKILDFFRSPRWWPTARRRSSADGRGDRDAALHVARATPRTATARIGPASDLYAIGAHSVSRSWQDTPTWSEEQRSLSGIYAFLRPPDGGQRAEAPSACAAARWGCVALPVGFDSWFARSTARLPGDRFDRASTQVSELAQALGVAGATSLGGGPAGSSPSACRRRGPRSRRWGSPEAPPESPPRRA